MENYKIGIKESSHVRKASLNISSNQESNKPVANTHWRKILFFQFLSINYWSKDPYILLLAGVNAL